MGGTNVEKWLKNKRKSSELHAACPLQECQKERKSMPSQWHWQTEKKSRLFPQYVKGRLLTTLRVSWYCILISLDKNINFVDFAIVCDSICNKTKLK